MAKKNSSKTATEKAMSASEPRVQVFSSWQGVNFKESPLGWEPNEDPGPHKQRQNDLKPNFLHVQNNVVTTTNLTLETRPDSEVIGVAPEGWKFTGVACLYHRWLFCVVRKSIPDETTEEEGDGTFIDRVVYRDINTDDDWTEIQLSDAEHQGEEPTGYEITEIGYFEVQFIAMTMHSVDNDGELGYEGEIFTTDIEYTKTIKTDASGIYMTSDDIFVGSRLVSSASIPNPTSSTVDMTKFQVEKMGDLDGGYQWKSTYTTTLDFCFVYTNIYGSTEPSDIKTFYCNHDIVTFSTKRYVKVSGPWPDNAGTMGVSGVDIYLSMDNKQTKAFVGHIDYRSDSGSTWSYSYLGALIDISEWTNVQLKIPEENTTKGVNASHFANHDSRLYFWGDPQRPYRLYIGGNPGSELSVARGLGGSFIDIEPGTGIEIMGTAKWKTAAGASIVTMMCGNPNTNMIKRFNLVETNTIITNEISSKGYMYEEVSNVIGCNSRWGYGVFADGLYSISRYGLMITTMAMEYNSQMKSQQVSDVIQPIFTERLGNRLDNARLVFIDGVVYIVLGEEHSTDKPTNLDQVILCYDVDMKAWYTFTHDEFTKEGDPDDEARTGELVLHAMSIDSQEHVEGLGIITENKVTLYPTTGMQEERAPKFDVLLETGEYGIRQPKQVSHYLCQIEFRFDYFIGTCDIIVEGIDYYGRPFTVVKKCNQRKMSKKAGSDPVPVSDGVMRDYVEWIRIDKMIESYRITVKGKARFRLNSINAKVYTTGNKIGLPYGYDSHVYYQNRNNTTNDDNHWIRDYNNLRRTLLT